jgi:hypothetical protein
MTLREGVPDSNRTPYAGMRLFTLLIAVLFAMQCVWILAAELMRPEIDQLPTDITAADAATKKRAFASVAASIGAVRGALWAQSAYTYAYLLWPENSGRNSKALDAAGRGSENLDRALRWGPSQSGAWLLLAGLGQEFRLSGIDPTQAIKMSFYTGPTEFALLPLRLRLAVQADKIDDFEIRQFVSRDLRLLLTQDKKPAITDAYRVASPAGKTFIEQTIKDIDPSALSALQTVERNDTPAH